MCDCLEKFLISVAQAFQPVPRKQVISAQPGKAVLLNLSFWFFQQKFVLNPLNYLRNQFIFWLRPKGAMCYQGYGIIGRSLFQKILN